MIGGKGKTYLVFSLKRYIVESNDIRIHVAEQGKGSAVLFWHHQLKRLLKLGFCVEYGRRCETEVQWQLLNTPLSQSHHCADKLPALSPTSSAYLLLTHLSYSRD